MGKDRQHCGNSKRNTNTAPNHALSRTNERSSLDRS
jgi:hypothetical protein